MAVSRSGPGSLRLSLGSVSVEAVVRGLNDGGLLIQVSRSRAWRQPHGVIRYTWGMRFPNAVWNIPDAHSLGLIPPTLYPVPCQVDGQSHVVHSEEEAMGTRLTIDSLTCLLANEHDPSRLIASSPGKLVRHTVEDGGRVSNDQPYAEVEVRPAPPRTCRRHFPAKLIKPLGFDELSCKVSVLL